MKKIIKFLVVFFILGIISRALIELGFVDSNDTTNSEDESTITETVDNTDSTDENIDVNKKIGIPFSSDELAGYQNIPTTGYTNMKTFYLILDHNDNMVQASKKASALGLDVNCHELESGIGYYELDVYDKSGDTQNESPQYYSDGGTVKIEYDTLGHEDQDITTNISIKKAYYYPAGYHSGGYYLEYYSTLDGTWHCSVQENIYTSDATFDTTREAVNYLLGY